MVETMSKKEISGLVEAREGKFEPPRIVLNAVEGWGKTSCGAHTPKPAMLMAKGETGYDTLLSVGLVPKIPGEICDTWKYTLAKLDAMAAIEKLPYKTLVIDAVGGYERMCHEFVCTRDFKGDWGEKGFASFQRGYDVSVPEWLQFLVRLDRVRAKGVMILMLGHMKVSPFKNPMGHDFDRYTTSLHHKTWGVTHKWSDAVFFGNFITITEGKKGQRQKGIGGTERILYTERRDAFDAKNRYGMPSEIEIPDNPAEIWSTIWKHLYRKDGKK